MQFLGSTWRAGTPPMAVPAIGPPTTRRPRVTRRTETATGSPTSGIRPTRSPARLGSCGRTERRATTARALYAYNHADAYVDGVLAQGEGVSRSVRSRRIDGARLVLAWAVAHVGRFTYNLGPPTDRGGSVQDMQSREPSGTTCDCSMFARWAFAQAGIDIGLTTSTQWTANGLLPRATRRSRRPS